MSTTKSWLVEAGSVVFRRVAPGERVADRAPPEVQLPVVIERRDIDHHLLQPAEVRHGIPSAVVTSRVYPTSQVVMRAS